MHIPLHLAVFREREHEVRGLLESNGTDPNAATSDDWTPYRRFDYQFPFRNAPQHGPLQCGAGWRALHVAAAYNAAVRCCELLVEHGADVDATTSHGWTALAMALMRPRAEGIRDAEPTFTMIDFLLGRTSSSSHRVAGGWGLAHIAVWSGAPAIFRKIVDRLPETLSLRTDGGFNVLHETIVYLQEEMVKHLVESHDGRIKSLLAEENAAGQTPLDVCAAMRDNPPIVDGSHLAEQRIYFRRILGRILESLNAISTDLR